MNNDKIVKLEIHLNNYRALCEIAKINKNNLAVIILNKKIKYVENVIAILKQ